LGSRWFPVAVVAAIVVAGALIAAAVFVKGDDDPPQAPSVAAPTDEAMADSATCMAWAKTRYDLGQVTPMPPGFVYGAPGIDELADHRAAQLRTVLAAFESQIEPTPPAVASAAHRVVDTVMDESDSLSGRVAIGPADADAVQGAQRVLNGLCAG
jgi:hypothetical protein